MRQDALDSIAYSEKAIRKMRKTVDNMSIKIIDKKATEKRIFTNELKRVQTATRAAAKAALNGDQMQASKGVRMVKYKSIQGGNVNILYKRGSVTLDAHKYDGTERKRHRFRSERSKLLASYWGESRSFVLRIQQHGTVDRTAGIRYSSKGGSGYRKYVKAKDYMSTARNEMERATENIVRQLSFMEELFKEE